MYRVVKYFTDMQDGDREYREGDAFPRPGLEVTNGRLEELAGCMNRHGAPLIEWVDDEREEEDETF